MIDKVCLSKEWQQSLSQKYKIINNSINMQILEKNINALYLLECLARCDMDFIFKGGTSLVLLFETIKRFSIDIDIIVENEIDNLEEILNKVVETSGFFIRYEENERNNASSKRMNLRHYKFFFNSTLDGFEKYVLLDIAFEKNIYPRTIQREIDCELLQVNGKKINVVIPDAESILGDKLTAIAPSTTGIGYFDFKEQELMKQLFDVDKLFDTVKDLNKIRESFNAIATREMNYRQIEDTKHINILDDIIDLSKVILYRGAYEREKLERIFVGISKVTNYMIQPKFLLDKEVLVCASKAMYLVSLINSKKDYIEKYAGQIIEARDISIEHRKVVKTIQKINPEAYFYIIKSKYFES